MRIYVYPYNRHSESAALIAKELGVRRLKRERSKIKDDSDLVIVNWGSHTVPYTKATVINPAKAVSIGGNKLKTFQALKGKVNVPDFTTKYEDTAKWFKNNDYVCSRATVTGNSGAGLVISNKQDDLPTNSPLYVRYIPKASEFRVHVVDGHVIRVQRKVLSSTVEDKTKVNWKIRNHDNGFIFQIAKPDDIPSKDILDQAVKACDIIGLHFAGVDVIWNNNAQTAYVLEVNTAPGIEGGTVQAYGRELNNIFRMLKVK